MVQMWVAYLDTGFCWSRLREALAFGNWAELDFACPVIVGNTVLRCFAFIYAAFVYSVKL